MNTEKNPWSWIPSLYYTQGLPYIMVVSVSVIMYKNLGVSNSEIGLYTSLFYLPWMLKPIWSPLIDLVRTKRWWTFGTQGFMGIGFLAMALALQLPDYFLFSVTLFWIIAFSSSTHDIAADGFYMLALDENLQAFFVGIRSTFYRIAMISGEGLFVVVAGLLVSQYSVSYHQAWTGVYLILGVIMISMSIYHKVVLPLPSGDRPAKDEGESPISATLRVFKAFLKKDQFWVMLLFVLSYRLGEGQLVKMAPAFLLDPIEAGGLALTNTELGLINGIVGLIALSLGGIFGGVVVSRHGLKPWVWPMILAINLPNAAYAALAYFQPDSFVYISSVIWIEKFCYGFGFAAFLMYLIYISQGPYQTAHYAFATAFMAAGMFIPGLISGYMQEWLGYTGFFLWVVLSAIPILIITPFVKIEAGFGKKAGPT